MNLEKYKNDGWGLSHIGFTILNDVINNSMHTPGKIRILEFGSGVSTGFFIERGITSMGRIHITSFENDEKYAFKPDIEYPFFEMKMRELVECDDSAMETMFEHGCYYESLMKPKTSELSSRQHNNFYDIKPGDLYGKYDIVLLDGPSGNGRVLAYLHLQNFVTKNCVFYIDDHTDYDIHDRFKQVYHATKLFEMTASRENKWESGGDFIVYRLK